MLRFIFIAALLFAPQVKAGAFPNELMEQAESYRNFLTLCTSGVKNSGQFCYKKQQIERELELAGWCSVEGPENTQIFKACTDYRDLYPRISEKTLNFDFDGIEANLSAQLVRLARSEDGKIHSEKFGFLEISCIKGGKNTIKILMEKGVGFHYTTSVEVAIGQNALSGGVKYNSTSSSTKPSLSETSEDYFFIMNDVPFAKEIIRALYDQKSIQASFSNEFEDKQMKIGLSSGYTQLDKKTLATMHNLCELFEL